jgi:carbonic anhydrase/acetyltransferase-like protein (isoleucine patch superfamily)
MSYRVVYVGRHPAPKDLAGRLLYGLGGVLRNLGAALDGLGSAVQGPAGDASEAPLQPPLNWAPFLAQPDVPAPAGQAPREVCARPSHRDSPRLSVILPAAVAADNAAAAKAAAASSSTPAFVAPNATVLGSVELGPGSSIWYGTVLRGDVNAIRVGARTNLQDNVVVHVARHTAGANPPRPTIIGSDTTVGHGATLHACTVGDGCLIGMGATVLDGAVVESGAIVAAGALVPPGSVVKSGTVWAGQPAKLLRPLESDERAFIASSALNYQRLAREHADECGKAFEELVVDRKADKERAWRAPTDLDVHQGIARDPRTQLILSMR